MRKRSDTGDDVVNVTNVARVAKSNVMLILMRVGFVTELTVMFRSTVECSWNVLGTCVRAGCSGLHKSNMRARLRRNAEIRQKAAADHMAALAEERQLTPKLAAEVVQHFSPLRSGSYLNVFVRQEKLMEDHNAEMTGVTLALRTEHAVQRGQCIPLHHGPRESRTVRVSTAKSRVVVAQWAANYFEVLNSTDPALLRWLGSSELSREVKCGYVLDMDENDPSPDAVLAPVVTLCSGAACSIVGAALVMWRSMEFHTTMPGLFDGCPISCSI